MEWSNGLVINQRALYCNSFPDKTKTNITSTYATSCIMIIVISMVNVQFCDIKTVQG